MPDDRSQKGARDRGRISLSEDYEVEYWTNALGVSKQELTRLVAEHGHSVAKIRQALRKQWASSSAPGRG
jgi:hypothetical protein